MLLKHLSSLRYLCHQGLALRGHDETEGNLMQLLMLRVEDCAGLKQWLRNSKYLSRGIATELVSIMAKSVLLDILSEI